MRIIKRHSLLKPATNYVIDSPQPSNISYWWNIGSLLGLSLGIQIITGVTLAMHYNPNVLEAFNSVEHIMRDVNNGWLIRYLHSNTASAFFFLVYLHIGRGLYYGSYKAPRSLTWTIGTVIFILMMATAFLGLLNSPKWLKFKNNKNNIKVFDLYNKNRNNKDHGNGENKRNFTRLNLKSIHCLTIGRKKREFSNPNRIYIRKFSSSSERNFLSTPSCKQDSVELTDFITEKNLNPAFMYENLSVNSVRTRLLNETRNLSGVYLIFNKTTLDYYIGSASTGKFNARFSNHLFNFSGSKVVKNAVKKYGISSFAFLILELFLETVTKENNKKLLDLEDFYLKTLLPNYNILTEAGSSFGYKHSEITRINMKTNYSEQRRLAVGSLNKGKSFSADTVELMKKAALSRKKPIYSEKSISNMKKKSKPILVYNLDYTVFGEFSSLVEAAKSLGCDQKTIARALKTSKSILKRRWIVKYV